MRISILAGVSLFATLVTLTPAAAQQRHSTQWRTQAADANALQYDRVESARVAAAYSRCVVANRYERARTAVLARYGSPEQDQAAGAIVRVGDDNCIRGVFENVRMRFSTEVLVGNLAQALVLREYPDLSAVVAGHTMNEADEAARLPELNAVEVFGRCIVQRDPAGAFALISSASGSQEERAAINGLRDDLPTCLASGSTITINAMFLRNSIGVASYRYAQQIQPRGAGASGAQ